MIIVVTVTLVLGFTLSELKGQPENLARRLQSVILVSLLSFTLLFVQFSESSVIHSDKIIFCTMFCLIPYHINGEVL
jgi:ABC-type antimicrobial peptide transport system permease subunit